MSNSLLAKINADAAAEATRITKNSDAAIKKIEEVTAVQVKQQQAEAATALEKAKAHQKLVATSRSKQAHKLAVQAAKREAVDAVFADALAKLSEQSADEYVATYVKLWQDAVPAEVVVTKVTASSGRKVETTTLLKAVNVTTEPVYVDSLAAGVVITTESGAFDLTLDRRFNEARAELEMNVVAAANS